MGKRKSNKVFMQETVVETTDKVRKYNTQEFYSFLCALISAYAEEHRQHPVAIGNAIAWMLNAAYEPQESEVGNDSGI